MNKLAKINFDKYQLATAIAIFFHAVGLIGLLYFDQDFFIRSTPFNLLLSFALIIWTQREKNAGFFLFLFIVFITGFMAEIIGVHTGLLFGDYNYGEVLGVKWKSVPLLIGINWCIIIYCCGITIFTLLSTMIRFIAKTNTETPKKLRPMSVIIDGAVLAVFFDWLMEPVAIKLGFWKWGGEGDIPTYNYFCWLVISMLFLGVFHALKFSKQNKFAVHLLLIQMMFFLLLRTFLK